MESNQTSENLALPGEKMTKIVEENQQLRSNQRKRKLGELFPSLSRKVDQLARLNDRLFRLISDSDNNNPDRDDQSLSKSSLMTPSPDAFTDPVLTYRLSWLLDFLRGLYGFKDCGVFLLGDGKGCPERMVLSTEHSEEFEDKVGVVWKKGDILRAISQKRRIILPEKKEGNLLIIPFKVLDKKEGFWAAHFKQTIILDKKKSAELHFWVELFASCIENAYLKRSSLFPQKEKSYHILTEKLFTTAELSKAVVHEINNSLQIILGRTQLLKMNVQKSRNTISNNSILEMIEKSANRVCSILKNFSDHLHRQSDKTTNAGEVNIHHILESNLDLLKYILRNNSIQLELKVGDELPAVYGNPGELELALLSLIWEIKNHLSSGGTIQLQTSTEEKLLCLDVYCAEKENHSDGYLNFIDLEANDQFKVVSQILERNHGSFKFEELGEREKRFSLRFPLAPQEERRGQEALQKLKW